MQVYRLDWYPEYDNVTGKKQMKLLPTVYGRKWVADPDAMPQDAYGRTCNLIQLEDMCRVVTKHAVSSLARVKVVGQPLPALLMPINMSWRILCSCVR